MMRGEPNGSCRRRAPSIYIWIRRKIMNKGQQMGLWTAVAIGIFVAVGVASGWF